MKIKNEYLLHEVAGNYVVVKIGQESVDFNGLITLSESSKILWELLARDSGSEVDELVKAILDEYEIDEETARTDILEFIEALKNNKILENEEEKKEPKEESKVLSLDMENIVSLIQVAFENHQSAIMKIRGMSMYPFLRDLKDSVEVVPVDRKLKKKDIILYKRDNGQFVLHRIIKVEKDTYTLLGDNQHVKEKGIREDQVIAVVSKLYKDGKVIDVNNKGYKFKVNIWCFNIFIRRVVLKIIHTFNKNSYLH